LGPEISPLEETTVQVKPLARHFCKTLSSPVTICIASALMGNAAHESALHVFFAAVPLTNPFNELLVFLQRIAEMNLDSICGQSYGVSVNTLTTEQILLSLLSRITSSNGSHTVFPVVRTERNVLCSLKILSGPAPILPKACKSNARTSTLENRSTGGTFGKQFAAHYRID
jgi:hypothetical protein